MALGTPTYPSTLDTSATLGPTSGIVAGTTALNAVGTNQGDQLGITNNLIAQIQALQAMVGITTSLVTSSHEYRIRRQPWKVWTASEGNPHATAYPAWVTINTTPYLSYAASIVNTQWFMWRVPWGAILTSGVIVRLTWCSATATTGNVFWGIAIENFGVATTVSDHLDTQTTLASTVGGTVSITTEAVITESNNTLSSGQMFRLQVQRVGTSGSDTMTGAAQLFAVSIESAA